MYRVLGDGIAARTGSAERNAYLSTKGIVVRYVEVISVNKIYRNRPAGIPHLYCILRYVQIIDAAGLNSYQKRWKGHVAYRV